MNDEASDRHGMIDGMTEEFRNALYAAFDDHSINGLNSDLVVAGIDANDCRRLLVWWLSDSLDREYWLRRFLHHVTEDGEITPTAATLTSLVQAAVLVGVKIERARWNAYAEETA